MPLEHSDLLLTTAGVASVLVGLAAVVVLLQPTPSGSASRVQSMRAAMGSGLVAAGGAVLALLLHAFDLPSESVWRISSIVVSAGWLTAFGLAARRFSRARASESARPRSVPPYILIPAVPAANALLWWNIGAPRGLAGARFATALVLALVISVERLASAAFSEA